MLKFKEFLTGGAKKDAFLKDHVFDFLGHLMSSHDDHSVISEASVNVDALRKTTPEPTDEDVLIHGVNMLEHPAVRGKNPTETARYLSLMRRGHRIQSEMVGSGGVHGHVAKGFASYMAGIQSGSNSWEDPRITQKAQLKEARKKVAASYAEVGYKEEAPQWLRSNTKTDKNEKFGDKGVGLSLAPARTSNVGKHTSCGNATDGCERSCLAYTTGNNSMLSSINSKIAKHQFFVQHPHHAARMIHAEMLDHIDDVANHNAEAAKTGEAPAIASYRPNMVTDFDHPKMSDAMIRHATQYATSKGVKFVVRDYTKHPERLYRLRASNYFLALSHTGTGHSESNDSDVAEALNRGHTVASVVHGDATHFYDHKTKRLFPINDGDENDRIEDGHPNVGHKVNPDGTGVNSRGQLEGVVRALRIKGNSHAIKDAAGNFVSPTTTIQHPEHGAMQVVEINKP